jgi:hypothetical protein
VTPTGELAWPHLDLSNHLFSFGIYQIYVDDEKFVDMSTSLSGSGPAYIFMLMEAMIDAGVHMGFARPVATTLVYHTLLGSTLYAMETGEHPAILRNQVTSPAGTTASAIYELENGKFRVVIKDVSWSQSSVTCSSVKIQQALTLSMLYPTNRLFGHAIDDRWNLADTCRQSVQEEHIFRRPRKLSTTTGLPMNTLARCKATATAMMTKKRKRHRNLPRINMFACKSSEGKTCECTND